MLLSAILQANIAPSNRAHHMVHSKKSQAVSLYIYIPIKFLTTTIKSEPLVSTYRFLSDSLIKSSDLSHYTLGPESYQIPYKNHNI